MENPFSNPLYLPLSQGGLTVNRENPLVKGGNEGGFETRRSDLDAKVRGYADRLYARVQEIYAKYGVSSVAELQAMVAAGQMPKGLRPGELKFDIAELSKMADRLRGLLDRGGFAPGEEFEAKKEMLYADEHQRLLDFFGEPFDVPPLPEGITLEKIEFWEKNGFKLQYWPRVRMDEDADFPGWKHKPGKRNNPKGQGIEFYEDLERIKNLPENSSNPNLQGLEPDELPGVWMLVDSRKKPDYKNGNQGYSTETMDDSLVRDVLIRLFKEGILPKKAWKCKRNEMGPNVFSSPRLWGIFKEVFRLDDIQGATVRLPRLIEANVMGQGPDWHGTSTHEWSEEMYRSSGRMVSGGSSYGGVSYVDWFDRPFDDVGFRPLVVFSQ